MGAVVPLIPAKSLAPSVCEVVDTNALAGLDVTLSKADAQAESIHGRAKTVFALSLAVGKFRMNVAGPGSVSSLVKLARTRLAMENGPKVADDMLGKRDPDAPNKLTDTERMLASMIGGGGMATTIGRLRVTATFVGYIPAR